MEPNNEQPIIMRERQDSPKSLWYIIIAVLAVALVGWYGYSAGWFSPRADTGEFLPVEPNNGIGDGGLPLNAAPIDSLQIQTGESFPVQQTLVVSGSLPNGCTYLNDTLDTRTEGDICTEALVPYEERIQLQVNNLPSGVYIVNVNGREISFELESDNSVDFNAGLDK